MKLNEWQKILLFVCNAILKNENKIVVVSPDKEHKDNVYNKTRKILSYDPAVVSSYDDSNCVIEFKNGSSITCLTPKPKEDVIRGKRADISNWLYDFEIVPQDIIDEAIKPFELPRCDKCEQCYYAKSQTHDGYTHYCILTGRDVGQSHFGMNSPKCCPKR